MSRDEALAQEPRLFRTALACGMLAGTVSAGIEVLGMKFVVGPISWGDYTAFLFYYLLLSWACGSVLLMIAALYRRSARLMVRAVLLALPIAGASVLLFFILDKYQNTVLNGMSEFAQQIIWLVAWIVVPFFVQAVLLGLGTASMFGFSTYRKRFVLASLVAWVAMVASGFVSTFTSGSMAEAEAVRTMATMLSGVVQGLALVWPVARLEREGVGHN